MASDDRELRAALRSVAERLDAAADSVEVGTALRREPTVRPLRRRAWVAVLVPCLAAASVAAFLALDEDGPRRVTTVGEPSPTPTTAAPPASPPTSSAVTQFEGAPVGSLPPSGVAVEEDDRLVLLDGEGTELGRTTGPVRLPSSPVTIDVLAGVAGPVGPVVRPGRPGTGEAPAGCDGAAGAGGVRTALCGGAPQDRQQVVRVDGPGTVEAIAGPAPGAGGSGHWRWALPSPDGRWVLAQWSWECEVPAAFLVPTEGGPARTVDGAADVGAAVASIGLGWASDGRAVVRFEEGACGTSLDVPGTYLVDPVSGERTLVRASSDPSARSFVWQLVPGG